MNKPMMACGCASNATRTFPDGSTAPSCAIHDVTEQAETPDLTGRTARCAYLNCNKTKPSDMRLAFFKYQPDKDHDQYYCGCYGWD